MDKIIAFLTGNLSINKTKKTDSTKKVIIMKNFLESFLKITVFSFGITIPVVTIFFLYLYIQEDAAKDGREEFSDAVKTIHLSSLELSEVAFYLQANESIIEKAFPSYHQNNSSYKVCYSFIQTDIGKARDIYLKNDSLHIIHIGYVHKSLFSSSYFYLIDTKPDKVRKKHNLEFEECKKLDL